MRWLMQKHTHRITFTVPLPKRLCSNIAGVNVCFGMLRYRRHVVIVIWRCCNGSYHCICDFSYHEWTSNEIGSTLWWQLRFEFGTRTIIREGGLATPNWITMEPHNRRFSNTATTQPHEKKNKIYFIPELLK